MDRATLVKDICKELKVRQPDVKTEGYLPKRVLVEVLLSVKNRSDELKHLRGIVDATQDKTPEATEAQ